RGIDRRSFGLALGILSSCPAGFATGSAVLLATRSTRRRGSSGTKGTAPQHSRLPELVPHTLLSHQLHRNDVDDFCDGRFGFLGAGISALSQSKSRGRDDDLWLDPCCRGPGLNASGRHHSRQVALAFSRFLFLGFWNWDVDGVPDFRYGPLHSIS